MRSNTVLKSVLMTHWGHSMNLRTQNIYYRVCGDPKERKRMSDNNEPLYLNEYIYCYYFLGKNIVADKIQDVQRYFKTNSDEIRNSVCMIKNIDIDLTNQNIKQIAMENERNRR